MARKCKSIDDQIALPTEWVSLDCIEIPANRREFDEATVDSLFDSIGKIGLLHPISVREHFDAEGDQHIDLVSGRNRLEALRRLGVTQAECLVIGGGNALIAELAEIDENLIRAKLSPAQEAAAITRRKLIYESLHPETRAGVAGAEAKHGRASATVSFAESTAKATGKSRRTVERAAARGKALGIGNLAKIANTSLDKPAELEALAAAPPAEQADLIERAAAGEQVTARRGNDVDACASAELRKAENTTLPGAAQEILCFEPAPKDLPSQEQWQRSLCNVSGDLIALDAYWRRLFDADWRTFAPTSDVVTVVSQAAGEWAKIARHVCKKDSFAAERKELKKKVDEANRKAKFARSSQVDMGRRLHAAHAEAAKLRDKIDSLLLEIAGLADIVDPAKLREYIEHLGTAYRPTFESANARDN